MRAGERAEKKCPFEIVCRDHGASYILPVLKAVEYDNNSVPVVYPGLLFVVYSSIKKRFVCHIAYTDGDCSLKMPSDVCILSLLQMCQ